MPQRASRNRFEVWLASVRTNLHPPAATDSASATTQAQGDQFDSPTKHLLLHMFPAQRDRCPDCAGQACLSASSSKAKGGSTGMHMPCTPAVAAAQAHAAPFAAPPGAPPPAHAQLPAAPPQLPAVLRWPATWPSTTSRIQHRQSAGRAETLSGAEY